MIVCPNCNHENPEGATQCEACYTFLPSTSSCPNCGATVQSDATFCGQCGFNLQSSEEKERNGNDIANPPETEINLPVTSKAAEGKFVGATPEPSPVAVQTSATATEEPEMTEVVLPQSDPTEVALHQIEATEVMHPAESTEVVSLPITKVSKVTLQHVQTNTNYELPPNTSVFYIGRPNDQTTPDIDVSAFPDADIVSRVHADIRQEGDSFYVQDLGSANGTYVNGKRITMGNREQLKTGDRIALGKQDKVSFIVTILDH